jgi:hypothetical protein
VLHFRVVSLIQSGDLQEAVHSRVTNGPTQSLQNVSYNEQHIDFSSLTVGTRSFLSLYFAAMRRAAQPTSW